MAFLDKLFRWKKKPFSARGGSLPGRQAGALGGKEAAKDANVAKAAKEPKAAKIDEAHGTGVLAHVIRRPHISEQASKLQALNQYVFDVANSASKNDVARAVYDTYGVRPERINIMRVSGKQIRFGRTAGTTKMWKKAIVTLPEGKTIDVYKK